MSMTEMAKADDVANALAAAQSLLGGGVKMEPYHRQGANSRVLPICKDDVRFALKLFPDWRLSREDRCAREWDALCFLREGGITDVPAPIAVDPEAAVLILEWLDGDPVVNPSEADIAQACTFLENVFALSSSEGAEGFPQASEACLSGRAIESQVVHRRKSFAPNEALEIFLRDDFDPIMAVAGVRLREGSQWASDLPRHLRRLIVADFGFHNALRTSDGRLRFFDFDYFGWDDPVKQVADVIFHPMSPLSEAQAQAFAARMGAALVKDDTFSARLEHFAPLFLLRWSLIVLNPLRGDRIDEAGPPYTALSEDRITKAKQYVARAQKYLNL